MLTMCSSRLKLKIMLQVDIFYCLFSVIVTINNTYFLQIFLMEACYVLCEFRIEFLYVM
jgi:hypothetical protein